MKPVSDAFVNESEEVAVAGMRAMKAFLVYQGENTQYYHKAKIGAVAATNYVRLRATETNRMAVEQQTVRTIGSGPSFVTFNHERVASLEEPKAETS